MDSKTKPFDSSAMIDSMVDELIRKQRGEIAMLRGVIASTLQGMDGDDQYIVSAYTPLLSQAIGVPDPLQWFHNQKNDPGGQGKRPDKKERDHE